MWEVDFETASYFIGHQIDEAGVRSAFEKQFEDLGSRWFIQDFVDFQYGELNPCNKVHHSVLCALKKQGVYKPLGSPLEGAKDKDKDKDKEKERLENPSFPKSVVDLPPQQPRTPPDTERPKDIQEVAAYMKEIGMDPCMAATWWHHYEAVGWKIGKNPIKKWRSAVQTWKHKQDGQPKNGKPNLFRRVL